MRDSTKGILIGTLATLGVVALVVTAWLVGSRAGVVLTDGARIRVPASIAPVREVLWEPADLLPDWINQGDENYEPRLSPDGRTLVFVRGKAGGGADLYVAERGPDGWSPPTPLDGINSPLADELGPALSADGHTLYFYSDREGGQGGYDLWLARRTDDPPAPSISQASWGEPENLGPSVNSPFNDYGPAPSPMGDTLYFASNRPVEPATTDPADAWPATVREQFERRTYDLYASPSTDRGYGVPERLASLSTPDNEGTPAVSPAGDFLYFSSDRPGGAGGLDIYRARLRDGAAGDPESIGWPVNTAANELDPAVSMGGFALHFSSSRDSISARTPTDESLTRGTLADHIPARGTDEVSHPASPAAENNPDGGAHTPPRYAIYSTISREVYREREPLLAGFNWAAAWGAVWPWLLLLALLLALLALLRRFMRDEQLKRRWRTLSLLAKCLILSLLLHALLGGLFTVWYVAGSVGEFLNRPAGGTRVALVSRSVGGDLASQIRGGLTQLTVSPVEVEDARATPEVDQSARIIQASLPTEASTTPDQALESSRIQSADTSPSDEAPRFQTPPVTSTASAPPEVATPAATAGAAASEAVLVSTASPTQPASPSVATPMSPSPGRAELSTQRAIVADATPLSTAVPESSVARPTRPAPVASSVPVQIDAPALTIGTLGSPASSAATSSPEAQVRVEADRRVESLEARPDTLPASSHADTAPESLAPARATPTAERSLTPPNTARDADSRAAAPATPAGVSSAIIPASPAEVEIPTGLTAPASRGAPAQEAMAPTRSEASSAPLPVPELLAPSPAASANGSPLTPSASQVADAPLASATARPGDAAPTAARGTPAPRTSPTPLDIPPADGGLALDLPSVNAERDGTRESSQSPAASSVSDLAVAPRPGLDLPADSPSSGRVDLRPGSGEVVDRPLAGADSIVRDADSPRAPASAVPSTVIPLDPSPLPIPALAIPQAIDEPPAPAEPIGTLAGVVRDATTGEPIPGARVRLDLPGVEPIVARAGTRGQYRLRVPAGVPENVAISAVAPGFTPASINVRVEDLAAAERGGEPLTRDFDLAPLAWDVVPIEADPQVRHLGNDEFEGAINSQFQRASEGLVYQAEFTLGARQVGASIRAAELLILAKGAQANNPVRINGRSLEAFIVNTPRDGSFGELVFTIPPRWLREGVNTIEIESVRGNNDLDDFEFVNPRLRLRPSVAREPKPGR